MCVSDGEVASEIVISAFVTASFPVLETEAQPEIVIPGRASPPRAGESDSLYSLSL
jgi:hypothetical protein